MVHSDGCGAGGAVASILGMSSLAESVSGPLREQVHTQNCRPKIHFVRKKSLQEAIASHTSISYL